MFVARCCSAYVKLSHPDVRTVYMIGEDGLEEELEMVGLRVVKEAARPAPGMTEDEFRENAMDPEVGHVINVASVLSGGAKLVVVVVL